MISIVFLKSYNISIFIIILIIFFVTAMPPWHDLPSSFPFWRRPTSKDVAHWQQLRLVWCDDSRGSIEILRRELISGICNGLIWLGKFKKKTELKANMTLQSINLEVGYLLDILESRLSEKTWAFPGLSHLFAIFGHRRRQHLGARHCTLTEVRQTILKERSPDVILLHQAVHIDTGYDTRKPMGALRSGRPVTMRSALLSVS